MERRLFRASWDDGLLDIFFGVAIVLIGILWALDLVALGAIVPAMILPFWSPIRRALVEPRMGHVEFSDVRTDGNRRKLLASLWIGVGALILFCSLYWLTLSRRTELLTTFIAGVPAMLIGLLACLTALGLGLPRFLLYGAVFVACGIVVSLVDAEPEIAMVAGGLFAILMGGWLLSRFLELEEEIEEETD